ncbi:MAG: hypothetical protein Q8K21_03360 [Hydrogenophaga sp.]|uniref:hypothetical protein n=1 Tax=Hydrogenophaga sp. TaxID=1904254 RepID=UPI002731CA9A|nr:hypothetical protein [Hydrogenophaga sp.]MDP2163251.1 hypothetical protein [Hydrogenophaga sp.]MDP3476348.1 hypothetical protein [Hydrogenophaga sp.]
MKTCALTLSLLLVAASAVAQTAPAQPVAKIVTSEGLVTVGFQNQMSNAVTNMPLFEGTRVMTTSTGRVSIAFDSGCRVTLKPNEVFSVSESECKALAALPAAGVAFGTPAQNALVLAGVAGFGLGLVGGSNDDQPLSGN